MSSRPDLVRAFLQLRGERRTGVVSVSVPIAGKSASEQTFIYLAAGVPVFAEAGSHGETLGRMLVRKGALTQEQYVEILGKMTDALVLNEQIRFGEVAVELGHMTQTAVQNALAAQVRAKIVRVFLSEGPTWTFEDSEARLDDVGRFPVSVEAAVLDAARWLDEDTKDASGLARAKTLVLAPTAPLAELSRRFELNAEEMRFLGVFDGRKKGDAILAAPEARDVDGPAIVLALFLTRAMREPSPSFTGKLGGATAPIAFKPVPPPAVTAAPPAAVTAVPPAAVTAVPPPVVTAIPPAGTLGRTGTVPMAFKPTGAAPAGATMPPDARAVPQVKATRASDILKALEQSKVKHDPQKAPASAHEAKLLAETAFQAGLTAFRQSRWAQAVPDLTRASQLLPDSEEYRLYAKWAQVNARSNEPPHPLERAELGRLALSAVKTDPKFAFGYYVAGNMAFLDNEADQAERLLTRAVKLDPSLIDAQRVLRLLQRRKSGGEGGGGGGFLGKKLW